MNNVVQLRVFFSMFAMYLPTLVVCLAASVVVLLKWRQAPTASLWALLGFGLALVLCFAMPVGQTILQFWVVHSEAREVRMWAFTALSIMGSLLHAIIYASLPSHRNSGKNGWKLDANLPHGRV